MPRTIKADGRTITVPDDATPEEINQIVGPAAPPSGTPPKSEGFWQSYDEKVAPLVTPTPHDYKSLAPGKNGQFSAGAYGKEAVTALSNMGAGGLGVVLHPLNTVGGILKTAWDASPPGGLVNAIQHKDPIGDMAKDAIQNPLETAETMAGQTAAMGTAARGIGKLTKLPGKVLRAGQESLTKTSPSDVANLVRDTSSKNAEEVSRSAEADKLKAEKHLNETLDAFHETRGRELSYRQEAQSAYDKAVKDWNEASARHQQAVQDSLHETKGRELQHEQKVKSAKEEAEAQNKLNVRKHLDSRNEAIRQRKESEAKITAEKLKQGKIGPTQAKLENAWSNLRAGVETAREKALGIGNAKYSGVNESLSHIESDPEFFPSAVSNATEALRGSKTEPTLLRSMETAIKSGNVATYADLQGDYSTLGKEISKGGLPGDVFHAYDKLHEAIGEEMQRIADAEGKGAELRDARNYWRRMKQTFGKPFNPTDTATSTTEKAAPDVASAEEQANRIRLLGSFDPDIVSQFNHVENIRKGAKSLPEPKSARQIEQGSKAPSIPPRKPVLPKVEPKHVEPPERVPIPEAPEPEQVKWPNRPDRVAPPDRPPETKPKITTLTQKALSDLKGANVDKSAADFRSPNKLATTFLGYDLMRNAFNALGNAADFKFGSAAKDLFKSVRDVGIRVGYQMGSGKMAELLENPETRASLSQITDRDISELRKLSPEQQSALGSELKAMVDAAPSKGVKVSPALSAWVGSVSGVGPKQKIGDILKPQ